MGTFERLPLKVPVVTSFPHSQINLFEGCLVDIEKPSSQANSH